MQACPPLPDPGAGFLWGEAWGGVPGKPNESYGATRSWQAGAFGQVAGREGPLGGHKGGSLLTPGPLVKSWPKGWAQGEQRDTPQQEIGKRLDCLLFFALLTGLPAPLAR